jgi:hypothetical protein
MNLAQLTDQIRNRWHCWEGTTITREDLIAEFALDPENPTDQALLHNLAAIPSLDRIDANTYRVIDDPGMQLDPGAIDAPEQMLNPGDLLSLETPVVISPAIIQSFVSRVDAFYFLEKESRSCQDCARYNTSTAYCRRKLAHMLPQAPACHWIEHRRKFRPRPRH